MHKDRQHNKFTTEIPYFHDFTPTKAPNSRLISIKYLSTYILLHNIYTFILHYILHNIKHIKENLIQCKEFLCKKALITFVFNKFYY